MRDWNCRKNFSTYWVARNGIHRDTYASINPDGPAPTMVTVVVESHVAGRPLSWSLNPSSTAPGAMLLLSCSS